MTPPILRRERGTTDDSADRSTRFRTYRKCVCLPVQGLVAPVLRTDAQPHSCLPAAGLSEERFAEQEEIPVSINQNRSVKTVPSPSEDRTEMDPP